MCPGFHELQDFSITSIAHDCLFSQNSMLKTVGIGIHLVLLFPIISKLSARLNNDNISFPFSHPFPIFNLNSKLTYHLEGNIKKTEDLILLDAKRHERALSSWEY